MAVGSMAGIIRDYPTAAISSPSTTTYGGYISHGHSISSNDPYPSGPIAADHAAEPAKHEAKHEHKHKPATSHQTFKIHHFHAVPVYVKKEHQHLLKHPLDIGGVNHKLKVWMNESNSSKNILNMTIDLKTPPPHSKFTRKR